MFAAEVIAWVLIGYAAAGTVFALVFVSFGIGTVDPAARHAAWQVRLLWAPGAAGLWPLMPVMWLRARKGTPPPEETP
jgi:hypothetical protein